MVRQLRFIAALLLLTTVMALAQAPSYSAGPGGAVSGQVQGQPGVGGLTAKSLKTSPGITYVSAFCQSTTSCNPGGGITDVSQAIIAAINQCNGSCNVVDDMIGVQTFGHQPFGGFLGKFSFLTNGASQQISLDGISTLVLPTSTRYYGLGGTSTGFIPQNTTIYQCNPLVDTCVNGGFVTQNTSATTITTSVTLGVMTVTLAAGAPFSVTATALNHVAAGRLLCIAGSTTASDNGCWTVASVVSSTAPQGFTLNVISGVTQTCAATCGTMTLDTATISFGGGGGNGIFHTRIADIIIDCHYNIGGGGIVNGQGEEGTGWDSVMQIYNCPAYGFRLNQDGIYGGTTTSGATNSGPYGAIASNFNPIPCGIAGGCACQGVAGSTSACSSHVNGVPGTVTSGTQITCGAGTTIATVSPEACQNPNYVGALLTGPNGNQGFGEIERYTCSTQDKSATNAGIPGLNGTIGQADQGICIGLFGVHASFGDTHTEFINTGSEIGGNSALNATWQEAYGGFLTSGISLRNGFWGFATGGVGIDIGQAGAGANINDIWIEGINIGNKTGTLIADNVSGITITGSVTEQVETYEHGHGTPPSIWSSAPAVGIQGGLFAVLGATSGSCQLTATATGGTINLCSTNATITSAGLATFAGGSSLGNNLTFSGATPTIVTSAANADLVLTPNGTGRVVGPAGTTTTCGFCFTGALTTGIALGAANILGLLSNGVEVAHVTGGIALGDAAAFKWSQTGASSGTSGVSISALGSSTTEAITVTGTSTALFALGTGNTPAGGDGCKVPAAGVTMSISGTAVPFCTWTLPNVAQTWAWQCHGTYTTSTLTDTLTLGVNPAQAPASSSRGEAMIYSTTTGVLTSGGAAFTASGVTQIFAGISVSSVTDIPFEFHGVIFAPATSGTFSLTGTLTGTTPSGTINAGTTCLLY